jgi:hypothetical protein
VRSVNGEEVVGACQASYSEEKWRAIGWERGAWFDGKDRHVNMVDINDSWNAMIEHVSDKNVPYFIVVATHSMSDCILLTPRYSPQ